ncbi:hypothetical protein FBU30_004924 [Linnemannia zychae]|nr:hypothetical protein FBU30_004924 [Linnemannia zychae]
MDLTLTGETAAVATIPTFSQQQQQQSTFPEANSANSTMDFFFPGALDQLQGATELDVQLNPLLMNRVTQLCLAKISIASSGRESLLRVAQFFWRRLQSDMFFMPLQSMPQTASSLDPNNMFTASNTEPFATWNWLQDATGLELDYFNLSNEANMTTGSSAGYTNLVSDPSGLSSSSSASSPVPSSTALSPDQSLARPAEFPVPSVSLFSNSGNSSMSQSNASSTMSSSMPYPDFSGYDNANISCTSAVQPCQSIIPSVALSVSDPFAFQFAYSDASISDPSNNTFTITSSPFTISAATEGNSSGRIESLAQNQERRDKGGQQTIISQSSLPRPSHEGKFSMMNDVSHEYDSVPSPEKTEMDVDKRLPTDAGSHILKQSKETTVVMPSENNKVDIDIQDVSDMDVDRAIQEMALHSAPSSPSKGHSLDAHDQQPTYNANTPLSRDSEPEFHPDVSASSLSTSFTARLVSAMQDEDLDMEEEELELHRIKRRRCSEDSSSSDSGSESTPTSPRTPPSNLDSTGGISSLHSAACLSNGTSPGLTSRRLYNLHSEGDSHEASESSVNPFLSSPMSEYVLQNSGMMSKGQHHCLLSSTTNNSSISTAITGTATTTSTIVAATATSGNGGMLMDGVSGGTGSAAVVVVEDLLNLNRQGEGEGQVGILATSVHTRYPTRSSTQRRII